MVISKADAPSDSRIDLRALAKLKSNHWLDRELTNGHP